MSVSHILSVKGTAVVTARPSDTVAAVVKLLAEKKIGCVVITESSGAISGIVSERDVVRVLAAKGSDLLQQAVSSIMSKPVKTCGPKDSEQNLMALMTAHRIRHLPVVDNGRLAGMVSIGDVVKNRIESIEREAADMKAYISGIG